jgi:hypothetical protein
MTEINQFYTYFPGGSRRLKSEGGLCLENCQLESVKKIKEDLDKLIASSSLDIILLKQEQLLVRDDSDINYNNIQEMIKPFYKKMIELGYSREELID